MKRTDFKDFNINIPKLTNFHAHMQFRKGEMAVYFRMKCYGESAFSRHESPPQIRANFGDGMEDFV